jgi:hypothetical protein
MVISVAVILASSSTYAGAAVVEIDIQSVCIPLGCVQDKAEKALGARDCAPYRGRNILSIQLPVDEVDLWVDVEGLLDGSVVSCIDGIVGLR